MKSTFTLLIFLLLISGCNKKTDKDITSTQISTTQCMKDTDCKGDRICEVGVCTSPQSNSTHTVSKNSHAIETKKGEVQETNSPLDSGTNSQCEEGINGAPAFGSSFNGGAYLCREKVETYWNDWYALNATQNTLDVHGEGKTTEFKGHLTINCDTGKHNWSKATDMDQQLTSNTDIAEIVPLDVIKKAKRHICKIK